MILFKSENETFLVELVIVFIQYRISKPGMLIKYFNSKMNIFFKIKGNITNLSTIQS